MKTDHGEMCLGCGADTDPDVCCCGSSAEGHEGDHDFRPMGCVCGYHDKERIITSLRQALRQLIQLRCSRGGLEPQHESLRAMLATAGES